MFEWFRRKMRKRRALRYLLLHPEDEVAVCSILFTLALSPKATARDAAETVAGRPLSDAEWSQFGAKWERPWAAIINF